MNTARKISLIAVLILIVGTVFFIKTRSQFDLPKGETTTFVGEDNSPTDTSRADEVLSEDNIKNTPDTKQENKTALKSNREILVTDGTKHSIPLEEILSGGPGKDGIPSIDNPKFVSTKDADRFLKEDSVGLGLSINGESRFYPYRILVWHEIVNDTVKDKPVIVTYCPLCATGVVFDRTVDGKTYEFGVSGLLWQSNLLMYNRTKNEKDESLWSQVLGEAVLGESTGTRLAVISSDTVQYGKWKEGHPDTKILSEDTGVSRSYGTDPYGGYYTDNSAVSFGATFTDTRFESKDFVLGLELNGQFKAYKATDITEGTTKDSFAGEIVTLEKSKIGEVRMFIGEEKSPVPYIGGFWFSWAAVHPETEVYKP